MSLDQFISRFSGLSEEYKFYGGEVTLQYEPKSHTYFLVTGDSLEEQAGVTETCHIIDKSEALVPWACKMMAGKLLAEAPTMTLPTGDKIVRQMTWQEYENLVLAAKSAHKDQLEYAGDIGHQAHAWIEQYIKAVIAKDQARIEELFAKFPEDPRAHNCCHAALDWMKNHNVRWLGTERKIYSRKFKYAGTMDGLCIVDSCSNPICCPKAFKDRLTIADWKTSNYLYIEYLLQTSSYMQAYNEEETYVAELEGREPRIAYDRWVIRLGKEDAEFDPWYAPVETFVQDFTAFTTALELRRGVAAVKERIRQREEAIREAEKAARQAAKEAAEQAEREEKARLKAEKKATKEAALKIKCKGADKYKGTRKPKCNGGEPCETCRKKYEEMQAAKNKPVPNTAVSLPSCQTIPLTNGS